MEVKIAKTVDDFRKVSPVLTQLRPQYTEDQLIEQIEKQQEGGYTIAYVEKTYFVLCVAGFVIGEKLAWQKHLYVDDLVTSTEHQAKGAGQYMMEWLKNHARENGCKQLHLDSGVLRFNAHKFYLRQGFNINSHHFAIANLDAN